MKSWLQWIGVLGVILGMFYYISGLHNTIDELRTENIDLKNKIYTIEKYSDFVVALVNEGKVNITDLAFFLPQTEVQKVSDKIISSLPFPINVDKYFYPSGWMGDGELGEQYFKFARPEENIIQLIFTPGPEGWAGIYWQYPNGNYGDKPGRNLMGAKNLTFWARGEKGNELIEFKTGGIRGKNYEDSFEKSSGLVKLSQSWKQYEIDLSDQDLSNVIGAFTSVVTKAGNPNGATFYIKDINFQNRQFSLGWQKQPQLLIYISIYWPATGPS